MDEPSDRLQESWDDIDDKDILIQILAELQTIRVAMTDETDIHTDTGTHEPQYNCDKCGGTIAKGDRETHARTAHKAPPSLAQDIFTRVD